MARPTQDDPLKSFRFRLEIDGIVRAGFSKVTGLTKEVDVVEYDEGGFDTPQKSAGKTKYPDLTIERGQLANSSLGGDDDLYDWSEQVSSLRRSGNTANYRRDMSLVQYGADNVEARRWNVRNGWISKYTPLSDQDASQSNNSFETAVISHEGFELERRR